MTDDMMTFRTLLEKTPDADILPEMTGFAAERLMEMEVSGLIGAALGKRSLGRKSVTSELNRRGLPVICIEPAWRDERSG